MGFALITGGGATGRYTVELDYGTAQKETLVTRASAAYDSLVAKITQQGQEVAIADARKAESLASLVSLQNELIAEMQATGDVGTPAKKIYDYFAAEHQKLVLQYAPVYDAFNTLRLQLKQAGEMLANFNTFVSKEVRQVWCCDLTENATGYVATVEIPGEQDLVLITPKARTWTGGDGTILTTRKAAEVDRLSSLLNAAQEENSELATKITTAESEKATLLSVVEAARASYVADPSAVNADVLTKATDALNKKTSQILDLKRRRQAVAQQIFSISSKLQFWNSKPSSSSPVYGDGQLTGRVLLSPSQAYYNVAILPGWQKFMPTYRWGTITNKNDQLNIVDVTLGAAASSAQGLNVNKVSSLLSVPVRYMTCNSEAFSVNDRVIVEFANQDWERPTVIGFLDNPKACPVKTTFYVSRSIIVNDGACVPPYEGSFPVGEQGILYYIGPFGYLATSTLANGAAYAGATFPSSGRHVLLFSAKVLANGTVVSYSQSNTVGGGVIAGQNVDLGARYLYIAPTYVSTGSQYAGDGALDQYNVEQFNKFGEIPTIITRSYKIFASGVLLSGETKSGNYSTAEAALAWVPSSQMYQVTKTYFIGPSIQETAIIHVTYTYVSGGHAHYGDPILWNVDFSRAG